MSSHDTKKVRLSDEKPQIIYLYNVRFNKLTLSMRLPDPSPDPTAPGRHPGLCSYSLSLVIPVLTSRAMSLYSHQLCCGTFRCHFVTMCVESTPACFTAV